MSVILGAGRSFDPGRDAAQLVLRLDFHKHRFCISRMQFLHCGKILANS